MYGMEHRFVRAIFPGSLEPITNGHWDVVKGAVSAESGRTRWIAGDEFADDRTGVV